VSTTHRGDLHDGFQQGDRAMVATISDSHIGHELLLAEEENSSKREGGRKSTDSAFTRGVGRAPVVSIT